MTMHGTNKQVSPLERLATLPRGGSAGTPTAASQRHGTDAAAWTFFLPLTRHARKDA
jgi:hypothetical protein